jgi:hypothetical protein
MILKHRNNEHLLVLNVSNRTRSNWGGIWTGKKKEETVLNLGVHFIPISDICSPDRTRSIRDIVFIFILFILHYCMSPNRTRSVQEVFLFLFWKKEEKNRKKTTSGNQF